MGDSHLIAKVQIYLFIDKKKKMTVQENEKNKIYYPRRLYKEGNVSLHLAYQTMPTIKRKNFNCEKKLILMTKLFIVDANYRNPSFGLATKAKGL